MGKGIWVTWALGVAGEGKRVIRGREAGGERRGRYYRKGRYRGKALVQLQTPMLFGYVLGSL